VSSAPTIPLASSSDLPPAPLPRRPGQAWERRILWTNLIAQIGIVVTGGAVRLTGSGLGCSTWPQCEPGRFTPQFQDATSWHPYIEFGNRTLTGVLAVLALATAWVIWRRRDRAPSFRLLGLVPLVGVTVQAVVGGLTVLFELHPGLVAGHFLISMALVAASTALLIRHKASDGARAAVVGPFARRLTAALVPLAVVVLVLGVVTTGSGPHSGDAEVGYRFALDPTLIARVHAGSVWLYVAGVIALVVALRRSATPSARSAAELLLTVTLLQGLIGYVQYFTGLPELLVGAHMLGASLLVVAQVNQVLSTRERAAVPRPAFATPA
jgi:cytochrome c oxidase assembly protein subunit 15